MRASFAQNVESSESSRTRAEIAVGDISMFGRAGAARLSSAIAASRAVIAAGDISTTVELLQALNVGEILRPAGGELERDQPLA